MPPRKSTTNTFARIDEAQEIGKAKPRAIPGPSPTPDKPKAKKKTRKAPTEPIPEPRPEPKPEPVIVRSNVRKPNTPYKRDGHIYAICPKELKRRLDRAVLAEKEKRDPTPMDLSIAVEEAVRMWLKKHGH